MSNVVSGWLFDAYPSTDGMVVWLIDREGRKHRCTVPFLPSFFLHLSPQDMKRASTLATRCDTRLTVSITTRKELYSDESWDVLQISVHNPTRFSSVVRSFEQFFPHFAFFDSDLLVPQLFLYETALFPLAYGDYEIDHRSRLPNIASTYSLRSATMARHIRWSKRTRVTCWRRSTGIFIAATPILF